VNTPAHLIFGLAAFGQAGKPRVTTAAAIGALLPDLSLYAMVGWCIFVLGVPPRIVFREYYYSDDWQFVFAIDNSMVLWGLMLCVAIWRRSAVWIAFAGAGLLHLVFDFLLHNYDARMHLWPLSNWVFESPFSYWDTRFHGRAIGMLELTVSLILCGLLLLRFRKSLARLGIVALAGTELIASGLFHRLF